MLTIARAVVEHSIRIMFFRHDGRGLPSNRGGLLYLLMAAAVSARLLRDYVDPAGFYCLGSAIGALVYLAALLMLFRPPSMAALVMANMFGYLLTAALYKGGVASSWTNVGIMAWELVALIVVLRRVVHRSQSPAQK